VVKNKMAPPFKQAEFDILYGIGISREGSLIDFGVEHEIVRKSGAWYTYEGDQLGQGKENARKFLLDNPAMAAEIETRILTKLGVGPKLVAVEPGAGGKASGDKAAASKAGAGKATGATGGSAGLAGTAITGAPGTVEQPVLRAASGA
jgi:recombination protein RecA